MNFTKIIAILTILFVATFSGNAFACIEIDTETGKIKLPSVVIELPNGSIANVERGKTTKVEGYTIITLQEDDTVTVVMGQEVWQTKIFAVSKGGCTLTAGDLKPIAHKLY